MNQKDYDALKLLREEMAFQKKSHQLAVEAYSNRKEHLRKEARKIEKSCDHKYPDGKNAWVGHFMFSSCEICGLTDL